MFVSIFMTVAPALCIPLKDTDTKILNVNPLDFYFSGFIWGFCRSLSLSLTTHVSLS